VNHPLQQQRGFHCVQCDREIDQRQFRQHETCTDIRCRQKQHRAMQQRERQREEAFQRRRALRRATADAAARQLVPGSEIVAIIVPSNGSVLCDLPEQRVAKFRRHLEAAVAESEALTLEEAEIEAQRVAAADRKQDPQPQFAELAACAACRGNCCNAGGEEAFVSAATVKLLRHRNPQMQESEILDAYLSRMPKRSYEDSCVFHAEPGCALPRELRADICNEFFCHALQRIRSRCASLRKSETVVLVSMGDDDHRVDSVIRPD